MGQKKNGYHVKDLHEAAFIACQMGEMPHTIKRETKGPIVFEWDDAEEVSIQSRMYYSGKEISAREFAQKFRDMKELLYKAIEESKNVSSIFVNVKESVRQKLDNLCKSRKIKEDEFLEAAISEKLEREANVNK